MRELRRMVGRGKAGLHRIAALGHQRREPHHVEAETGIALVAERGEPFGEQARGCARARAAARAVPTSMRCTLPSVRNSATCSSRAPSPRRSSASRQFAREMLDGAEHIGLERDRIGKAPLGDGGRHRQARRDRFVLAARAPGRCGARSPAPKRAASGARGRSITSAMRLSPTCASAATISGAMRSAASGKRAAATSRVVVRSGTIALADIARQ